jgi:hypothetical protein
VQATFTTDPDPALHLTFDRDIEVGDSRPELFHVVNGITGHTYIGNPDGAGRDGPRMGLDMDIEGSASGGSVLLTVDAGNGVVASDDGAAWAGVSGLVLPWPASQIVSVEHSETDTDRVIVNVSQQMSTIDDPAMAFEVSVDGVTWQAPTTMGLGVTDVTFIFDGDVSDVTQWRVQHPEVWHFADGIGLSAPLSGTIG